MGQENALPGTKGAFVFEGRARIGCKLGFVYCTFGGIDVSPDGRHCTVMVELSIDGNVAADLVVLALTEGAKISSSHARGAGMLSYNPHPATAPSQTVADINPLSPRYYNSFPEHQCCFAFFQILISTLLATF